MASRIRRLGILSVLAAVLLLAVVLLGLSYSDIGAMDRISLKAATQAAVDSNAVPPSVAQDASRLAAELFGSSQKSYRDFVDQLITTYSEARNKDFVILFNPGGWGLSTADRAQGWLSILDGMKSELDSQGYTSLLFDYRRTSETSLGRVKELIEMMGDYRSKAEYLADRVQFLTDHIPELRVIITGESNGTIISDSVMSILRDNPHVYSIQTGPPFWGRPSVAGGRTLVLRSNGVARDAFSYGDILNLVWSNVKAWLGLSSGEGPGTVLNYFRAPGHDYSWQYPSVANQIMKFLEDIFEDKRG